MTPSLPTRRRLLVVEDDPDTRGAISAMLVGAGYDVVGAEDAEEAVDLITRGLRPRLIVADLRLPGVSGTDLLRYIQDDHELRIIPRIIVTALRRDEVTVTADAIFHKPCDLNDVLEAVRRLAPAGRVTG
jgi:CheY-like chemotaxis protein